MPRKYFPYRNVLIFLFVFAVFAFLHDAIHEFSGVKAFLGTVASEVTRPIGVAVSLLAVMAIALGGSYVRTRNVPISGTGISCRFEHALGKSGHSILS